MNLFDLSNKSAIVTGGNGGIGLGMARGLAAAGAAIAVAGRNPEKNAAARKELDALGSGKVISVEVDVTNSESVTRMVTDTVEQLGGIDILVNNAGTNIRKRAEELPEDEWHTVINTNLTSAYLCSKACYPAMKAAGGGKVLNNGSMLSLFGSPWAPAYAASKGGIVQLTKSLATAWAQDNIQVNCFLPGWIDTDLTRKARQDVDGLHEHILNRTPADRWGDANDFQGIAVFLASAASDFVTGTAIPIDGGFSVNI
jgi:2-dehydro-3-deoxy-D-gluconate 5-dehydrogenase